MAPQWYLFFFCFLVWNVCHAVDTICNDRHCAIQLGSRGRTVEAPKNLHLAVPKTGSKIDRKHEAGYAFFHVHCTTMSQEQFHKVQNFEFSSFLSGNKMCLFYISSWIIFHKLKRKQRVTDQYQHRPSTLQHLSNFSENILFFTISWPQHY